MPASLILSQVYTSSALIFLPFFFWPLGPLSCCCEEARKEEWDWEEISTNGFSRVIRLLVFRSLLPECCLLLGGLGALFQRVLLCGSCRSSRWGPLVSPRRQSVGENSCPGTQSGIFLKSFFFFALRPAFISLHPIIGFNSGIPLNLMCTEFPASQSTWSRSTQTHWKQANFWQKLPG